MKSKLRFGLNLVYSLLVVVLIVFGAAVALSVFAGPGNFRVFIVGSSSMSPALKTGSVALIAPPSWAKEVVSPVPMPAFEKGDIITYLSGKTSTTHRVVGVEETNGQFVYQTKGDANKAADREKVSEKQVLGKAILSVPYVGYGVNFARTQMGYIFLIVVPITLVIYSEILNINKEIRRIFAQRKKLKVAI
ncbi:MAG: signal peptidase I [Candidatus Woykebacteria bacterium RBG_16_43_9]|uniref:Signal peptidase I n=1 Tax=Candidatus Woykebacteria bacterium RBG_16_43_9 TaxID=1802596 RepID=A0A1G1WGA6_9BACT|nr:MAG: signal peptidase I [Candidatus Woykebacteria bacterium RBG_16_43_9]